MSDEIALPLRESSFDRLVQVIEAVYGMSPNVDCRIQSMLLSGDPKALAKLLNKRIQSIKRDRCFIDYNESFDFSRQLFELIEDIDSLTDSAPQTAFELVDAFIQTHNSVFERVDDSNGSIGESYRQAVCLWLDAAALGKP